MKKDVVRKAKTGDDLEILSEIIKNDPWLLEKVMTKIRYIRSTNLGVLDSMAGKTDTSAKPKNK
ncbi:MAG: hypothetical protein EOP10_03320 [Proteobacteria bacterium]|nr:MAG: hypothetical protein EOP10_03320 [Pseudomonadota bacterium]